MIIKDELLVSAGCDGDALKRRIKRLEDVMKVVEQDRPITWLLTEYSDEPAFILKMAKNLTEVGYVFKVRAKAIEGVEMPPKVPFMTISGEWRRCTTIMPIVVIAIEAIAMLVEEGLPVRFVECGGGYIADCEEMLAAKRII